MAIEDAYATAAEYRARVTATDDDDDATILGQLTAVSRYLDDKLGRGSFTKDASVVTRHADGNGRPRLWLPFDIASTSGLIVKCDLNGDYDVTDSDETLTINTHFWVGPADAAQGPDPWPYQYLDVVPNNGRLSAWPDQQRALEITAITGWPSVPGRIKEATVSITRQLRDMQESGFTLTLQNIDAAVRVSSPASWLIRDLMELYSTGPVIA